MEKLHLHFETSQNCEEDTTFRVSLPAKMALYVLCLSPLSPQCSQN